HLGETQHQQAIADRDRQDGPDVQHGVSPGKAGPAWPRPDPSGTPCPAGGEPWQTVAVAGESLPLPRSSSRARRPRSGRQVPTCERALRPCQARAVPFRNRRPGAVDRHRTGANMESIGTPQLWVVFTGLVLAALAVDLLVLRQNGPHKVSNREALVWSLAWIALAMAFNAGLWWYLREQLPAAE